MSQEPQYPTRAKLREELREAGVIGDAAELVLDGTGYGRHLARVAYIRAQLTAPELVLVSILDACGVGGWRHVTGAGTYRHPMLHFAGKARKWATDGDAWSAAIAAAAEEAFSDLHGPDYTWLGEYPNQVPRVEIYLRPTESGVALIRREVDEEEVLIIAEIGDELLPPDYAASTAAQVLFVLLGEQMPGLDGHGREGLGAIRKVGETAYQGSTRIGGTTAEWATLYNGALAPFDED